MTGTKHQRIMNIRSIYLLIIFSFFFILCPIDILGSNEKINGLENNKKTETISEKKSKEKKEDVTSDLYSYEKPSVEEESYAWLIIKTILILGFLVGGFYYFFRFVTRKTGIKTLGGDVVQVLSIVPIGQNRFLQIIDLAGRILVLGVTDASVNLITEIKDRDEINKIKLESSKSKPIQPGGFQEYISSYITKLLGKINVKSKTHEEYKYDADDLDIDRMNYLKRQKDRLKRLNGLDDES